MINPNRTVSADMSSLKVVLNTLKQQFEEDCTVHVMSPVVTTKTAEELMPFKKVLKCGTSEITKKFPKQLAQVTSKENLYLADQLPTLKNTANSSIDLQALILNAPEDIESNKTYYKYEHFLNDTQKKNSKLNCAKFELEYPNELDTREVLTEDNMLKILKRLFHSNYLFWNVSEQSVKEALPFIFLKKYKAQSIILSEGENPYNFFIIQTGIIVKRSMKHGVSTTKYLDKGKMFGEKSLFDQMKRTSSYQAEGNCLLWGINIATFYKLLNTANRENFNANRRIIEKVPDFRFINSKIKDQIALNVYEQKFAMNETILDQGSVCACCFIVKKGELNMRSSKHGIEKIFKSGEFIGDWSLNSFHFNSGLEASGKEEVTVLVVSNRNMRTILGDNLYSLNWKNLSRIAFSQSPFFARLPSNMIEKLIENLQICCYEKNQTIVKKGSQVDSLYITLDGNLRKTSSEAPEDNLVIGEECALFGEQFLMRKSSLKKDESVIIDCNGVLGEISRTTIERIIAMKFTEVMLNESYSSSIFSNSSQASIISLNSFKSNNSFDKIMESIDQNDIEVLEIAGEGQFGLVFLVRVKNEYYALKICVKAYIISRRFELYLINEKIIQSSYGEFPFLIKFHKSFQDESLVFFLMDYVNGQDLSSIYYSGNQTFPCIIAQFYIAQLILTAEFLHSKNIVHRDIKLNNILVDHFGYIKLIDFGIAKVMTPGSRTFTIVGTPHYMAPEIILGKGYDYAVDIWAIGICLYEMLFGKLPFGDNAEDPIEVYGQILQAKGPAFDKKKIMELTYGTVDLLVRLLNKEPMKRIGKGKDGFKEIKEHSWFLEFDWEGLLNKKMKTFHPQKEKNLEGMRGKKLAEHLKEEIMQSYLKKEEKRLSMIQGWDDIF